MKIELNQRETRFLLALLDHYLSDLGPELRRSMTTGYREELHEEIDFVRALRERFEEEEERAR